MMTWMNGCSINNPTVINDYEETIKQYSILMPDFPKPQRNIHETLQKLKIDNIEQANQFYDYFKRLMIFESKYIIFKEYLQK